MTNPGQRAQRIPEKAGDLPTQYTASEHEGRIWALWERAGAFAADPARVVSGEARPYCVLMPPFNVTDRLHIGHALNGTLQDVLVRAHRMMGFETLWLPGTDHAGIATQTRVEKRLLEEEGKGRHADGREAVVGGAQAGRDESGAPGACQPTRWGAAAGRARSSRSGPPGSDAGGACAAGPGCRPSRLCTGRCAIRAP